MQVSLYNMQISCDPAHFIPGRQEVPFEISEHTQQAGRGPALRLPLKHVKGCLWLCGCVWRAEGNAGLGQGRVQRRGCGGGRSCSLRHRIGLRKQDAAEEEAECGGSAGTGMLNVRR